VITELVELPVFTMLADFLELVDFAEHETSGFHGTCQSHRRVPAHQPTTIYKLGMTSMGRNISIAQLGLAAWLCSLAALVHLLIS